MAFMAEVCRFYISYLLFAAALAKLVDLAAFRHSLQQWFNISRRQSGILSVLLVVVEACISFSLLLQLQPQFWLWIALLLFVCFSLLIFRVLVQGQRVQCSCFGGRSDRPLMWHDLVRNLLIIIMILVALNGGAVNSAGGSVLLAATCAVLILPLTLHLYEIWTLLMPKAKY